MSQQEQAPSTGVEKEKAALAVHDTSDFPPAQVEETQVSEPVKAEADELPEKLRGKTPKEIAEMYRNAESELGRARNEIGQIRRLADELIGVRRAELASTKAEKPERAKLTTDALLTDPDTAVVSAVRAEIEEREAGTADRVARLESELMLARFERKHPDYKQRMEDPKFVEWVQKTPYRAQLAQGAIQGNFVAADELFSLYEEFSPKAGGGEDPQVQKVREAGLVRTGGSTASGVVQNGAGKKIWSRAELIKMRIDDPEGFDRLYKTELETAYKEKRVR